MQLERRNHRVADLFRSRFLAPREDRRTGAGDRAAERAVCNGRRLDRWEAGNQTPALRLDDDVLERHPDQVEVAGEAAREEAGQVRLLPDDVRQRDLFFENLTRLPGGQLE